MYEDLTHALAELDIKPGETRVVPVEDYELEIRRPAVAAPQEEAASDFADMVMLEPWVEFPPPTPIYTLRAYPGKLPLPDPARYPVGRRGERNVIYDKPAIDDPVDQGDLFHECPILTTSTFHTETGVPDKVEFGSRRAIVLTQTCDFANGKVTAVNIAEVLDAQTVVADGLFKAADVKGPLRAGRVWGWYFLPAEDALGLPEMIVDFRRLHTVRLDLLAVLCKNGQRRARVKPLYREHLAKHFADTFSRIGLPKPYETMECTWRAEPRDSACRTLPLTRLADANGDRA